MESLSHLVATIDSAYLKPSPVAPNIGNDTYLAMHYDNEGQSNMGWTGFQSLDDNLPESTQIRKVAASCSRNTGDLHMIFQTFDNKLLHSIRFGNGNSQSRPDEVNSIILQIPIATGPTPETSGSVTCSLDPDDNLHLFVIDNRNELLYTFGSSSILPDRSRKITFQQFWEAIPLPVGHKIKVDSGLSCTSDSNGNLHLYITDTDGVLWYNIRDQRGVWNFWNYVPPVILGSTVPITIVIINNVACAPNQNGNVQICAIDSGGTLLYNVYDHSTGKFRGWINLVHEMQAKNSQCTSNPYRFLKITCSTDPDNTLHVCGILSPSIPHQGMGLMVYTWRTFNTVAYPVNCFIPVQEYAFEEDISAIPISISIAHN
ncbi:MAG TPA: hypothetical protein VFV08_11895 [Puia sp.]|nr:hypothetical protein [Puia sp.]